MTFLKQNWIKVGLGVLILVVLFFIRRWNNSSPNTAIINDTVYPSLIVSLSPKTSPAPLLTASSNEAGHKSVSFYDEEPRDIYLGDYTVRVEKGWTTNIPTREEIWKYLKVLKDGKVIYEVDAQWVEPWGYKLTGYDEYKIGNNTYFLFRDWNGATLQCCQQAISLVFNNDKFMYGKIWEAVNDNEYDDYKNKIIKLLIQGE